MDERKMYPLDEMKLKEEFSPYLNYENITGGQKVQIEIPSKYSIDLTLYNLIPGISVIIDNSDLNDKYTNREDLIIFERPQENLIINLIIEGQCQLKVGPDKYMFIKDKDIYFYKRNMTSHPFSYIGKTKIYHIIINKAQFHEYLAEYNNEYGYMIDELFLKVSEDENILFKSTDEIQHIMKSIIEFNPNNEISHRIHIQTKTLEILLILYEYNVVDEKIEQRTYSDAQIKVVRNIKNSLSRNIASYVSLDALSLHYGINLTTLKNCFRDMYGKPLYTWYKEYKFHRAKDLIINTDYPISKIAHMIGYKSSSKFAKAFKKEMGVLPSSYRKKSK